MIRLSIILLFWFGTVSGQAKNDYTLYSLVIDSFINTGVQNNIKTTQVVVIKKMVPGKNEISFYAYALTDSNKINVDFFFNYDPYKIKLYWDSNVSKAILLLEQDFFNTPLLDAASFKLDCETTTMSNRVFRKNICRNSKGKINKGWKSFYEKYPGAHGVFEFSKIIYSGNYACFYAARYSGDFSARGDIVIMQKENGLWRILTYFNVWME